MNNTPNTFNTFNSMSTKKDRAAQSAAYAALVAWCKRNARSYLDDCHDVDVTALALACAEAHGCDSPGEHHPAWDAAAEAGA